MFIKKMLMLTVASVALNIVTSMTTIAIAGGDIEKGKAKATACFACHGEDGNGNVANPLWPKLAGQSESYITKQLTEFKNKKRNDPIMLGQVATLSAADIADLATYYASQKEKPTTGGDASKLKLGKTIFKGGNLITGVAACASCHGPKGNGIPSARFPKISKQNAAYVKKQLQDFRTKKRTNDYNNMMTAIAVKMTDDEIDAVAEYIMALK